MLGTLYFVPTKARGGTNHSLRGGSLACKKQPAALGF
jgi:hypothetical protein